MFYATKSTVSREKYKVSNPIFLCTISSVYICKYIRMKMIEIQVVKQINLSAKGQEISE
jgi:hypothetical protein